MMNRLQLSPQSGTHDAFRKWLSYNPEVRPGLELPNINWNAVMGLTLATVLSGGVWFGLGMVIVDFWK